MDLSRSSTPDAPPQDLWSSILDSVSSSRSIPSKQILLLGQPSTGKSTLAAALLQKQVVEDEREKEDHRMDFAVGYDWADVRDEADEDTLARLSVYTVPSASPAYTALLPHFLPPRTAIPHTLAMIVLDWTKPWTFLEDLYLWLEWVETWTKGDGARELEIAREEGRERLQAYLQHYTEPSAEPLPTNPSLTNTLLPLGPGTFTHNSSGISTIVVCTKADLIDEGSDMAAGASGMGSMVKGKAGDWEERTDGIMQVLRTICLKYGASLFYTTPLPTNLQVLRQHALHLLFAPPAPSPGGGFQTTANAATATSEATAPVRNLFPFQHKPNTLDRDRVVVPAGWDSWGKITVMREGFEPKMWGEAWERDLEAKDDGGGGGGGVGGGGEAGAKKLFAGFVLDQGIKPPPLPAFNSPMPEQVFLAKHYDENAKKPDRDPRGAFRNPTDLTSAPAGIVGPMGSSSFSLPTVERALSEMEMGGSSSSGGGGGDFASSGGAGGRLNAILSGGGTGSASAGPGGVGGRAGAGGTNGSAVFVTGGRNALNSSASSAGGGSGAGAGAGVGSGDRDRLGSSQSGWPGSAGGAGGAAAAAAAAAGRATTPTSAGPPGGPTQHEVLQNFFQSLLNTSSSTRNPSAGGSAGKVNGRDDE